MRPIKIKTLLPSEFDRIRSTIKNSNDSELISEFENAPCFKAYYRSGYNEGGSSFKWIKAPETAWFETRNIWKVNVPEYDIYKYQNNIYVTVNFTGWLDGYYRWRFSEDFAKKIGLI